MSSEARSRWLRGGFLVVAALGLIVIVSQIKTTKGGTARDPLDEIAAHPSAVANAAEQDMPASGERVAIEPAAPESQPPTYWRNPHREHANFQGVGNPYQKYHSSLVKVRPVDDAWVKTVEESAVLNPTKVPLTQQDREHIKAVAGALVQEIIAAQTHESELCREATNAKVRAEAFVETLPNSPEARASFNVRSIVAKHDGADRFVSLHFANDKVGVVVVTAEEAPEALAAKARRSAAYDELVEFLFSYFEVVANR
jgi:hypothetical protein